MISLSRPEIEASIDLPAMVGALKAAYRAASAGQVNLPPVGHITFPEQSADCHIKYGHQQGDANFVIKVATGFPPNAVNGLPTGNGLVLVLSAETGEVRAVLHDEMLLTDVRTGLGGAIASQALARQDAQRFLLLGTGPQAKWQIEAHRALMPQLTHYAVWGRNRDRAEQAIAGIPSAGNVELAVDLENAVRNADVIVTATGSTKPLIHTDWVKEGTHITAVGADAPGKQELDLDLVARADRLVVDSISQCVDHGEVSHAADAQRITQSDLIELGAVLDDSTLGRIGAAQVTIADLTGIAAQDIAIANAVLIALGRKS